MLHSSHLSRVFFQTVSTRKLITLFHVNDLICTRQYKFKLMLVFVFNLDITIKLGLNQTRLTGQALDPRQSRRRPASSKVRSSRHHPASAKPGASRHHQC